MAVTGKKLYSLSTAISQIFLPRCSSDHAGSRVQSASLHRYSPVASSSKEDEQSQEIANINDLEDYIELLYEDISAKVRGSSLILQLARNPDNLEELSQNETLLGALSRVLREEWKVSIDLSTNIIYVFFCFSTFSQFHSIIAHYKIGSLVMDIADYEVKRYAQWHDDLRVRQKALAKEAKNEEAQGGATGGGTGSAASELAKAEKRFTAFVTKQEQALRVSIYLLLNLSEDVKVEEKMTKKRIVQLLASLLERKNTELLILVISFLKKLSCFARNKEEMKSINVVDKLAPILSLDAMDNFDLVNAAVRLLLNLSFDSEVRSRMIKVGLLPKLVLLMSKCAETTNDEQHPRSSNLQNSVCCVLYHLSMEDKVKSMFAYTDCIPLVMKMILETTEEQVSLEVMALCINLAANKRNAQLICEGHGLRVLMQRAFHYQDALVMKCIRNISQHEGSATKNQFIEFIGDIADAVQRADSMDFVVECLGILGNLTIPDLDFDRLIKEYDLIPWIKARLNEGQGQQQQQQHHYHQQEQPPQIMDDLLLEVVVFLGTCVADSSAAITICEAGVLEALIDLLKAKQEDDEIVLQVVYVFHQLCSHEESRSYIIDRTDVVAYLTDLMHDKNPEVQRVKKNLPLGKLNHLDFFRCVMPPWTSSLATTRLGGSEFALRSFDSITLSGWKLSEVGIKRQYFKMAMAQKDTVSGGSGIPGDDHDVIDEFLGSDEDGGVGGVVGGHIESPIFDDEFEQLIRDSEDGYEDPTEVHLY